MSDLFSVLGFTKRERDVVFLVALEGGGGCAGA
jgi:hypothetical protein